MPTKNSATRRPYSVLLLALLTWASVVSFATASPKLVAKPDLSVEWHNAPARRNLRNYSWEVVNKDDESSEDRGFEGFDMSSNTYNITPAIFSLP
ncbi:unnamed protein product [Phytophthora lilii]|uniref:Unnamed protein product n=1 Tax=Phytophthora lilii TaxID=2077276 RepID=A0A9W7DA24_9STRA|nr:unnamed protein product [Phytophthora lilii]